eukprot:g33544.t1
MSSHSALSHKSVRQEGPLKTSKKSAPQESRSYNSARAKVLYKSDSDREVKRAALQALMKLGCGPRPPQDLGNGDDIPPPPNRGGKGKGKRKDGK